MDQYVIYLKDHNEKPLSYYFYSILENGKEIKKGTADHNGMILLIKKDFIDKNISFLIYNEIYKKGTIPATDPFYFTKEMNELFVIAPEIFEVSTSPNKNIYNDIQDYVQSYYITQFGDTIEKISERCNTSIQSIRVLNNNLDIENIKENEIIILPMGSQRILRNQNLLTDKWGILQCRSYYNEKPVTIVRKKYQCLCNRDITLNEFKEIIKQFRQKEHISYKTLWGPILQGGANPDANSYEDFVIELNRIFRAYNITSCMRKAHFINQIYHETDRLRSSQEYSNKRGKFSYDPYRGRGLLQLTHVDAYKKFSDYINNKEIIFHPEIIATNIKLTFDSAGWVWSKFKEGLNVAADNDDIYYINVTINGGFNHFKERILNFRILMEILQTNKCENIHLNKTLGKYKYSQSKVSTKSYWINRKNKFEEFDDE